MRPIKTDTSILAGNLRDPTKYKEDSSNFKSGCLQLLDLEDIELFLGVLCFL